MIRYSFTCKVYRLITILYNFKYATVEYYHFVTELLGRLILLLPVLKKNKEIKGLQNFLADYIRPVIETKDDQNVKKVVTLLNER